MLVSATELRTHSVHLVSLTFELLTHCAMSIVDNKYAYTTGGEPDLVHRRPIGKGSYGDVHEVRP